MRSSLFLLGLALLACVSQPALAANIYVGVRCPNDLYVLTGGASTTLPHSVFAMDGYHFAGIASDHADLDCDTGCGAEVGDGDCISLGSRGDSTAETAFWSYIKGTDGWVHVDEDTPTVDATVDEQCGELWFRLTVPGASEVATTVVPGHSSSHENRGTESGNTGDFARLDCNDGIATLTAGGLGSATKL